MAEKTAHEWLSDDDDERTLADVIQCAIDEAVAEAVKVERKRCKAVAIHRADWWEKQPSDTEYNRALRDFSQGEALAIALDIGGTK
jgi:hypothetical protein